MSSRRLEGGRISVTSTLCVTEILRFAQDDILGRGEISRVLENIHSNERSKVIRRHTLEIESIHSNERSDVASEIGLTFLA